MAVGDIGAVIERENPGWMLFSVNPSIIKGPGNLFLFSGGQDARVVSFTIDNDGNISAAIDALAFEGGFCSGGNVVHIAGDVYAFCYRGVASNWIRTFTVDAAGNMGGAAIASFNLGTVSGVVGRRPHIVHVIGNIYVVSWTDIADDGWWSKVQINDDGTFVGPIATWEWQADLGVYPFVLNTGRRFGGNLLFANVASEVTAVLRGRLRTETITDAGGNGGVAQAVLFDGLPCNQRQTILHVSGDVYAIFYARAGNTGWVQTVSFDGSGAPVLIDNWEWDAVFTQYPVAMTISLNEPGDAMVFAIIGFGAAASPNHLKTLAIELDGTIRAALIDSLPLDADPQVMPGEICQVNESVYAVVYYRVATGRTYVVTVDIETRRVPTAQTVPATEVT